jgi:hypothetical protein
VTYFMLLDQLSSGMRHCPQSAGFQKLALELQNTLLGQGRRDTAARPDLNATIDLDQLARDCPNVARYLEQNNATTAAGFMHVTVQIKCRDPQQTLRVPA